MNKTFKKTYGVTLVKCFILVVNTSLLLNSIYEKQDIATKHDMQYKMYNSVTHFLK